MADYSSLKVVDLKKVLKERSLPVSGNKAELLKRLQEADDAAPGEEAVPEPEPEPESQPEIEVEPSAENINAPEVEVEPALKYGTLPDQRGQPEVEPAIDTDDVAVAPTKEASQSAPTQSAQSSATVVSAIGQVNDPSQDPSPDNALEPAPAPEMHGSDISDHQVSMSDVPLPHTETVANSETEVPDAKIEDAAADTEMQAVDATKEDVEMTNGQSSVSRSSMPAEQTGRLKRSRSPAPDEAEVRKKLKSLDGEAKISPTVDGSEARLEPEGRDTQMTDPLVATGAFRKEQSEDVEQIQSGSREVTPSQHAPTSTLYIRNFKRPLLPGALQDHLIKLAKPGNKVGETLQNFYLDRIKTHCFVTFEDSNTAVRVRNGLHDKPWPETVREVLWADFIPEGKAKDFREIEERGDGQRRWVVKYDKTSDGVTARLTDQSTEPVEPRKMRMDKVPDMKARGRSGQEQGPPRDDHATGFKTLDDLFRSTKAKPRLYYLPVNKEIAESRLARLSSGRGSGRGLGDARYTFQKDELVDDGPDNGLRLDRPRGFVGACHQPHHPVRDLVRRYRN